MTDHLFRFRWVQCQIDELSRQISPRAIRNALKSLPPDLNETYRRMILQINPSFTDVARRALMWLSAAQRPLTIDELGEAVIIDLGETELDPEARLCSTLDVIYACGCLIENFDNSPFVALAHHSVKDYLCSSELQNTAPKFYLQVKERNIELAKICLTYLLYKDFENGLCSNAEELKTRLKEYPLYLYAAHNWPAHAKGYLSHDADLRLLANNLLHSSRTNNFRAWIQTVSITGGSVCAHGLQKLVVI